MNMVLIRNGRIFWQRLAVVVGFLFSLLVSVYVVYLVAEEFFFDKFFYQKSVEHGYWIQGKSLNERDFGKRSEDLIALDERFGLLKEGRVLGDTSEDNDVFTVAVIGDSYVWGQGVRFEDTVTQVLEEKLNMIRPTEVLALGRPGSSVLDYLSFYELVRRTYNIDLYVFVLVHNDYYVSSNKGYSDNCVFIKDFCIEKFYPMLPVYDRFNFDFDLWSQSINESMKNPVNLCVMEESLKSLPNEKSIYFISDEYMFDFEDYYSVYRYYLNKYDKHILSDRVGSINWINDSRHGKYNWKNKYFRVSRKEGHPSDLAHQVYADIFYKEIVENNEYGFN